MSKEDSTQKCIGLWGKIFGHKFVVRSLEWISFEDFCQRCGMPKGGWK